jgi:hypothetical protein
MRAAQHLVCGAGLQVPDVAGVAVVDLLLALATGEANALGVHDHHEVARVGVRREEDVLLAAQQPRDAGGEARAARGIKHPPLPSAPTEVAVGAAPATQRP